MIEMIVIALIALVVGFVIADYFYDKKLARMQKANFERLLKAHSESWKHGWDAGLAQGRREMHLEMITKRDPQV